MFRDKRYKLKLLGKSQQIGHYDKFLITAVHLKSEI